MQLYEHKQESFNGISGMHYRRNPFGKGDHSFARYPGPDKVKISLHEYVSEEVAYSDVKEIATAKEVWELESPEGKTRVECDKNGDTETSTIVDLTKELIKKYGFEAINARKCTITN